MSVLLIFTITKMFKSTKDPFKIGRSEIKTVAENQKCIKSLILPDPSI